MFRVEQTYGEEREELLRAALADTEGQGASTARARLQLLLAQQLDGDEEFTPVTTRMMLSALLEHYGFLPLVMVAVVIVPITEELLFRFVLGGALEGWFSARWANLIQATLFALCHEQWVAWPTLFSIGFFAGKLRRETSDLTPSVLLHGAWNLLVALAMYTALGR